MIEALGGAEGLVVCCAECPKGYLVVSMRHPSSERGSSIKTGRCQHPKNRPRVVKKGVLWGAVVSASTSDDPKNNANMIVSRDACPITAAKDAEAAAKALKVARKRNGH